MIVRMSRRAAPGREPAREAAPAYDEEGRPSKTQRKRASQELQDLGSDLAALPRSRLDDLALPVLLREALIELHRTRSHEGQRRQRQYIGKLMRTVDAEPLREVVAQARLGQARDALTLHEAERWRAELLASDEALTRWVGEHPAADVQQLRSLVRQARAQPQRPPQAGQAVRQDRSHRDLFKYIRDHLTIPT